jgi:hypothetical protein
MLIRCFAAHNHRNFYSHSCSSTHCRCCQCGNGETTKKLRVIMSEIERNKRKVFFSFPLAISVLLLFFVCVCANSPHTQLLSRFQYIHIKRTKFYGTLFCDINLYTFFFSLFPSLARIRMKFSFLCC